MQQKPTYDALQKSLSPIRIKEARKSAGDMLAKNTLIIVVSALFVAVLIGLLVASVTEANHNERIIIFFNVVGIVLAIATIGRLYQIYASKKAAVRRMRFEDFCNDNSMSYVARVDDPSHQGLIFSVGGERRSEDVLISNAGGEFEVGNYTYVIDGRNRARSTHTCGYIRIQLPRRVAHMILDSKSNNMNIFGVSLTNLPVSMKNNQTLQLEGDFNKYFTLYAPVEYERDALYVFTPDLMAVLIDHVSSFDVEVVDDQLFIYGRKFDLLNTSTWEKIFTIISTVGDTTISRTDNYVDERVGNKQINMVAREGRRLRQGLAWQIIVVFAIYVIGNILQLLFER